MKDHLQAVDRRFDRSVQIDSARLVRAGAMQRQADLEATLKFRAELRLATDVLITRDLSLTEGRQLLAQSIERRFDAFVPIFRASIRSTVR